MPSSEGLLQYVEPAGANSVVTGRGEAMPFAVFENMPLPVVLSKACTELAANSKYWPAPVRSVGPTAPTGSGCAPGTRPAARMLLASNPSNWPNQDPAAGDVVSKPTQVLPPAQVLFALFPAHHS